MQKIRIPHKVPACNFVLNENWTFSENECSRDNLMKIENDLGFRRSKTFGSQEQAVRCPEKKFGLRISAANFNNRFLINLFMSQYTFCEGFCCLISHKLLQLLNIQLIYEACKRGVFGDVF